MASGVIKDVLGGIGKACSAQVPAPTTANTSVTVTVTDTNHSVWLFRCGRRGGWGSFLLCTGPIRWVATQTSNQDIQIQGLSDNTLRVTYAFAAGTSDHIQVFALD